MTAIVKHRHLGWTGTVEGLDALPTDSDTRVQVRFVVRDEVRLMFVPWYTLSIVPSVWVAFGDLETGEVYSVFIAEAARVWYGTGVECGLFDLFAVGVADTSARAVDACLAVLRENGHESPRVELRYGDDDV